MVENKLVRLMEERIKADKQRLTVQGNRESGKQAATCLAGRKS